VVASTPEWARQAEELAPELLSRVNERLGYAAVKALDVRVRRDRKG
jgi:hypothetical protein